MLFTRCPHCDTIFRLTDEALAKAGGRVRCGRCANVFDAKADLRESPEGATVTREEPQSAGPTAATSAAHSDTTADERTTATATDRAGSHGAAATITPAEIEEVLAGERSTTPTATPSEPRIAALRPRGARMAWRVAAAIALLALGVQAMHYFRHDIVVHPVFGSWLTRAYGVFGIELEPRWHVEQYRIIDSAATATPNGSGTWKVRARFANEGPLAQPYPLIHLELKDRWQETVRSRNFTPDEYLSPELPRDRLMRPGETAQAALELVDPGPDVSGFELDVCVEIETNVISCGKDEPFL
jgi:predicted Zn finger-like uncharacterized protein